MTELQELEYFLMDDMAHYHYFAALKRHLTRGGFIKDRNGRWCKEGDRIKVFWEEENLTSTGTLIFRNYTLRFAGDRVKNLDGDCGFSQIKCFELIEPCEPDVCKDFKGYGE